jgi:hypothetical protein
MEEIYENYDNIYFEDNGTFDNEEFDTFIEFNNDENEVNKEEIYSFDNREELFIEKSNVEELIEIKTNKINSINNNSLNKEKLTKKIKEFKENVKMLIKNYEKRNEKISIYLNSSERKKRKMRNELIKKKERMNLILSKKNIQKRILQNTRNNNCMNNTQFFQKQEFLMHILQKTIFTPIFDKKIKKEKIDYLGKKRLKF